jgi:exopolysaccharide production protein ExoZ
MGLAILAHRRRFTEPLWLARLAGPLEPLGDASYSTYLVHGLVLTMLFRSWTTLGGPPSMWLVPVCLAVATSAGWAVHAAVERPVIQIAINAFGKRGKVTETARVM